MLSDKFNKYFELEKEICNHLKCEEGSSFQDWRGWYWCIIDDTLYFGYNAFSIEKIKEVGPEYLQSIPNFYKQNILRAENLVFIKAEYTVFMMFESEKECKEENILLALKEW